MESNLKYRNPFLIVALGVLAQLLVLPFFEVPAIKPDVLESYIISKVLIGFIFLTLIILITTSRYIKSWIYLFHIGCLSYVLVGQFFHPGYQFAVIEFMFICAIVFEGFSYMSTLMMILYAIEYYFYSLNSRGLTSYPLFHYIIMNGLLSSWIISVALERFVNRVKNKQGFLDKKLRYKGIKTDLLLHDIKNKLQPLVFEYSDNVGFQEILKTIQSFNSFQEDHEVTFEQVALNIKTKLKIPGEITVSGTQDFFIDQMDLQTILSNLMTNSQKASQLRGIELRMHLNNTISGFSFEDNAGGLTDEQFKFFTQKDIKPYPGHEKNGLGILLLKKLVEHQGGKFVIKRIANGTRFEINY